MWSQGLCSSECAVEPQYEVRARSPARLNCEKGSAVGHDISLFLQQQITNSNKTDEKNGKMNILQHDKNYLLCGFSLAHAMSDIKG